jgi:hypothetical protein
MNEPLAIEGFYHTRLAARRVARFVVLAVLVAACALLGSAVPIIGIGSFLLVYGGVSW